MAKVTVVFSDARDARGEEGVSIELQGIDDIEGMTPEEIEANMTLAQGLAIMAFRYVADAIDEDTSQGIAEVH